MKLKLNNHRDNDESIGVPASNKDNSESEVDYYPLKASEMEELKHPAKPLCPNEPNFDTTIVSSDDSEK